MTYFLGKKIKGEKVMERLTTERKQKKASGWGDGHGRSRKMGPKGNEKNIRRTL